jgi:hypothetical protein
MELAGHLQVEEEVEAAVAAHEEHFPTPADALDPPAAELPKVFGIPAKELGQEEADFGDLQPDDLRTQGSGDGFDFGKFGHRFII